VVEDAALERASESDGKSQGSVFGLKLLFAAEVLV
jgi:hypothetical protein